MGVMMGIRDDDSVASLAARLARLDKQLGPDEQARVADAAGQPLAKIGEHTDEVLASLPGR